MGATERDIAGTVREVALRYVRRRKVQGAGEPVRGPADVARIARAFGLTDSPREVFGVVMLDGRHRVLGFSRVSEGTLTASLVHPREVYAPALYACAAAVVAVHNHPSGDPTPSTEDREVTRRLADAGKLIGVPLLDHVVVADRGWSSLSDLGALPPREVPHA
jgi:DNA repair protein RadC